MSWWENLLAKARQKETASRSAREADWDGQEMTPELELRQPFSDGTEEFFGDFLPHDDQRWRPNKQVYIGLGITAGVLAGVGIAVWLKRSKRRKTWRDLLAKK